MSVNVHYKPLPLLSYYKSLGFQVKDYPIATSLWQNEISLPVYYNLSIEDVYTVIKAVVKSVKSNI